MLPDQSINFYPPSGEMRRRDFFKVFVGVLYSINSGNLFSPSQIYGENSQKYTNSYERRWNFQEHIKEWIESKDFEFPCPDNFKYTERIMPLMAENRDGGWGSESRLTYYVSLNLWPKEKVDLKIQVAGNLNRLSKKPDVYKLEGVKGRIEFIIDINRFQGKRVYYEVYQKKGKGPWRLIAPTRSFKHPKNNHRVVGFLTADNHIFDDMFHADKINPCQALPLREGVSPVYSGLKAEYFNHFLEKFLKDPYWFVNADPKDEWNIECLKNTFHLAATFAYIYRNGEQPDFIIKFGDDAGLQGYRYERQGLQREDYKGNAKKLWERERLMWSLITPVVPVYQVIGNHDGEGPWNLARPFAVSQRKKVFRQPGLNEGGSPDENYYIIPLADGNIEFIVLDVIGCNKKLPKAPEDWTLGEEQMKWLKEKLKKSNASLKFMVIHHLVGGSPNNPNCMKKGGYGRLPLFTRQDYEKYINQGVNPDEIEQVEITELALKHGISGILYAHDHLHFFKEKIAKNSRGKCMFGMCVGTTNKVSEEAIWRQSLNWIEEYGYWEELKYLNSPLLEKLTIDSQSDHGEMKTICTSKTDPESNLRLIGARIGDVVDKHLLSL